jgi:hypothetical protein
LHWVIENKSGSKNIDHYLDDFLFGGEKGTNECKNLMLQFLTNHSLQDTPEVNEMLILGPFFQVPQFFLIFEP